MIDSYLSSNSVLNFDFYYVFIGTDVMEYIVAVDDFFTQIRACSVKLYVSEVETLKGEVK